MFLAFVLDGGEWSALPLEKAAWLLIWTGSWMGIIVSLDMIKEKLLAFAGN
jgi:hypothetical protein